MSTSSYDHALVDAAADQAGLTGRLRLGFTNTAASSAMEGMVLTVDELRAGAEIAAGRVDAEAYIAAAIKTATAGRAEHP